MANGFGKEEIVAFEQMLEGFNDALVMSKTVNIYNTDQTQMERAGDVIWRPKPYIAQSYSGTDATSNFDDNTQLVVPATINTSKHATAILSATEMRDALQEGRLCKAAQQKLASDINTSLATEAVYKGSLFVKRSSAAAGFVDVAQCDSIMNEQGVPMWDRFIAIPSRDYNSMADNLATRSTMTGKPTTAYEKALIGDSISGFTALKLDTGLRITAAAGGGGITIDTRDVGAQYYTPAATFTSGGATSNKDNRFQTITVSSTTSVAAGDAFTIANVQSVHQITKQATGQLKTFRVVSVDSGTTMTITPPIITNQVAADASAQYQNCTVTSKSATAAITFLNTVTGTVTPFWQRESLEILPGRYAIPTNAGVQLMRATTDSGIEVVMQKFYDINTMKTKFRWDVLYGVVCKDPEQAGIMMFSQT